MTVRSKKEGGDVFYDAKGALTAFLKQFRVNGIEMRKGEALCSYAHPNKYAAYYLKATGEEIARVYEIHPLVLKNWDLENLKIGAFEIHFGRLAALKSSEFKYKPLPKFPEIEIDISVTVDKKTPVGDIQKIIAETDKTLIRQVRLFDIYEGSNLPEGKKSLAFKVLLRSDERTLIDSEMKQVQQSIFERLTKIGGEIRGLK
jgi:phenylalanyl-tRNA synthetase beta chain